MDLNGTDLKGMDQISVSQYSGGLLCML